MRRPPVAETLLRGFIADPDLREAVLGDLAEEWNERAADDGAGAAGAWYRRQALRTAPHLLAAWWRHTEAAELWRTLGRAALVLAAAVPLGALTFVGVLWATGGLHGWPPGAGRDATALWMILAGAGPAIAGGLVIAARSRRAPMIATLLLALGWIPVTVVPALAFPTPPGPPVWLCLAFPATLSLATVVGGAAATLLGWPDRAEIAGTEPSTPEESMTKENTALRLLARPVLAAAVLLTVPLVAMRLTDEVAWTLSDFVVMGALVVGVGLAYELTAMKTGSTMYRLATGVALGTSFLLVWSILAVGYVGASGDPADVLFGGVLAVGLVGALLARFRPGGMARAMVAVAVAQATVVAVALIAGLVDPGGYAYKILGITGIFVALWLASAWLFRRAARERPPAPATAEG
jgi:hypothetical protein